MALEINLTWFIVGILGSLFGGLSGALYQFVLIKAKQNNPITINKLLFSAHVFVSLFIGFMVQISLIVFAPEITIININQEKAAVASIFMSFLGAEFIEKVAKKKAGISNE